MNGKFHPDCSTVSPKPSHLYNIIRFYMYRNIFAYRNIYAETCKFINVIAAIYERINFRNVLIER